MSHTLSSSKLLDIGVDGMDSGVVIPDWIVRYRLTAISACPLPLNKYYSSSISSIRSTAD
jgi:hypothetical protein